MKTLKLFNAVVAQKSNAEDFVTSNGYIIEADAVWAKDKIIQFYNKQSLNGEGLNKTFHKSWKKILNSTRGQLMLEQIKHYVSTYGSNFKDEVYIPDEKVEIPMKKLSLKVIQALTAGEMTSKCLALLQSGLALKEETIDDLLSILVDELSYSFTGNEKIKNKEAIVKIADMYNVLPKDTMEFFRYIIYRATGATILIKNDATIEAIKVSRFNPGVQFERFGLEKLAEIFNRFKPLFLAFKPKCSKTINKISKLSKKYHKPMIVNPLNYVTSVMLSEKDTHWLDNATPFALFKALSACRSRMNGQYAFSYRIRNGKSFVKTNRMSGVVWPNYEFLYEYLRTRFDFSDKKFYLPNDVEYALPTSEKMYVGDIPTGSKFYGESLAVGIYWEDSWGARDLDLSGLNIGGKVGWNSTYKQGKGELMYSGDQTSAQRGAVEYLYAHRGLKSPTLINNNVFNGKSDCEYKIIVGKGSQVDYNYMMNPNKLFLETKCHSVQKQTILGMLLPEKHRQCFVLLNFGAGHSRISGNSQVTETATKALFQQWSDPLTFREVICELGGKIAENKSKADYDFSLDKLQKDSFMKVFTNAN